MIKVRRTETYVRWFGEIKDRLTGNDKTPQRGEAGQVPELVEGPGAECEGGGAFGVRFDKLNELRGEAGQVPEPVEGPGAGQRGIVLIYSSPCKCARYALGVLLKPTTKRQLP